MGLLLGGCDALLPADPPPPVPQTTAATVKPDERPAAPAATPETRRPVVPGYLAPAKGATKPDAGVAAGVPAGEKPAWEQLLDESDAYSATGRWEDIGPARASEVRAFAAIRALAPDDPRYVEAQCVLARRGHVGADVEAALLGAVARLRAQPPEDPYKFLDRDDLLTTELYASVSDDGTINLSPQTTLTSVGDCSQADIAMLLMMLIESYHTFGMFNKAYAGTPPPSVPDAFRAASQTLLDLHAELVRVHGAKHPRPAALIERMYWACHWSQRKRNPKICYLEKDEPKMYAQVLAVRVAGYGEDHVLTRASLLRVGAVRLAEDRVDEARGLLIRAMAGELDSETKAKAAAILGLLQLKAGDVEAGLGLLAPIEAAGDRIYGDDWLSHGEMLQLYSSLLRKAGRHSEALRVFRKFLAIQPAPRAGSTPMTWPGYAELLAAAGETEAALAEYGRRLAEADELERTGANAGARQMGRDQRLADLRARAAVRRAAGEIAGADADLAEVQRIEGGPPVTPDP